jgi:hypothetical protein
LVSIARPDGAAAGDVAPGATSNEDAVASGCVGAWPDGGGGVFGNTALMLVGGGDASSLSSSLLTTVAAACCESGRSAFLRRLATDLGATALPPLPLLDVVEIAPPCVFESKRRAACEPAPSSGGGGGGGGESDARCTQLEWKLPMRPSSSPCQNGRSSGADSSMNVGARLEEERRRERRVVGAARSQVVDADAAGACAPLQVVALRLLVLGGVVQLDRDRALQLVRR